MTILKHKKEKGPHPSPPPTSSPCPPSDPPFPLDRPHSCEFCTHSKTLQEIVGVVPFSPADQFSMCDLINIRTAERRPEFDSNGIINHYINRTWMVCEGYEPRHAFWNCKHAQAEKYSKVFSDVITPKIRYYCENCGKDPLGRCSTCPDWTDESHWMVARAKLRMDEK